MPDGAETLDLEYEERTEEDVEKEAGEVAEGVREVLPEAAREAIAEIAERARTIDAAVDDVLEERLIQDRVETEYDPIDERGTGADPSLADLIKEVRELKASIGEQSRSSRGKVMKIVTGVLIGLSFAMSTIVFVIRMKLAKDPKRDGSLTEDQIKLAKDLIRQFQSRTEVEFWGSVADYVDKARPSIQTQAILITYAKKLAEDVPAIDWGPTEKGDHVATLLAGRASTGKDSELYRAVLTLKHGRDELARKVKADLCELALARIWASARPRTA